jgi:tetratricopeptide (TPR) repeat protein
MSVLMKALEKAAQDRDKAPAATASSTPKAAGHELSLETVEAKLSQTIDNSSSPVVLGNTRTAGASAPPSMAKPAASAAPLSGAQAQAAAVLNAYQSPSSAGAVEWIRSHPIYVFGGLAGLFLLLYGAYVYVQVAHPGLLIKTPPRAPVAATAPARAPATPASANTAPDSAGAPAQTADTANSQLIPLQSVFAGRADLQNTAPRADAPKEIAGVAPPLTQQPAPPVAQAPRSGTVAATQSVAPPSRIAISRGDTLAPRVNPAVSEAYAALEAGRLDTAQRLYNQALRGEPANIDALLGLAAIAQHENRHEDAQRHFLAILDVEPRHALAQSGLVSLMSRADPQAAESRLKQLLAREPSPPLYFSLGNVYAEQGLWPQAQQAYFQAHTLEPRNPDYAYNLAVGLEHLGQQKLALGFYRKAAQLAAGKGSANFDPAKIQGRITQLAAQFE